MLTACDQSPTGSEQIRNAPFRPHRSHGRIGEAFSDPDSGKIYRREVCKGIEHLIFNTDLEVKMRTGGSTRIPNRRYPLTSPHLVILFYGYLVQMSVIRVHAIPVMNQNGVPVPPEALSSSGEYYPAVRTREHGGSCRSGYVESLVESPPSISERRAELSPGDRKSQAGD